VVYLQLILASVRSQLQYRASFIIMASGQFLVTLVEFAAIAALFARFGTLRGWSLAEVALLYGMVNVPTAVWIDEDGRIVRPPEPAGVNEGFRHLDLATFSMPADAVEAGVRLRRRYFDAVRDWVRRGADSPAVLPPEEVRRRMGRGARWGNPARAAAHLRVAEALYRRKDPDAAQAHFAEAARLWPENWAYQRQARQLSDPAAVGELDAGPDFWRSVEQRGEGSYYPPVDIPDTV